MMVWMSSLTLENAAPGPTMPSRKARISTLVVLAGVPNGSSMLMPADSSAQSSMYC